MSKTFVILDGGKLIINGMDHQFNHMLLEVNEKNGEAEIKITTWTNETKEAFLKDLRRYAENAKMLDPARVILQRRIAELERPTFTCVRCGKKTDYYPGVCTACFETGKD